MPAKFIQITTEKQLDTLFDKSHQNAVVLIKHSNSCGISADILHQLGDVNGEVHVIVIQENRSLSNAAAERTGHRHQSPQAFVIKDGKPVYHATHYGIDPQEIETKLSR